MDVVFVVTVSLHSMKSKCLFNKDSKMTVSLLHRNVDIFTCKRCGYDFSLNEVSVESN